MTKIVLAAALTGVTGLAFADYSGSREDRMQRALADYRSGRQTQNQQGERDMSPNNTTARNGSTVKRGAHNAGQAIKHGAQRVGHAVGTGVQKTGQAIGSAGSKLKSKSTGK